MKVVLPTTSRRGPLKPVEAPCLTTLKVRVLIRHLATLLFLLTFLNLQAQRSHHRFTRSL